MNRVAAPPVVPREDQSQYRQVVRATSLFGGVEMVNIVITILRTKIIAALLGPAGFGIVALLTSTTGFLAAATNFGLRTSAVKDIAAADQADDRRRVGITTTVLRRLVVVTGLIGCALTAALAPWLSEWVFGTTEYTLAFVWLSVTLLFDQVTAGLLASLQGLRKLNYLARASVSGAVLGLIISAPIYYVWRLDGIVPAIVLISVANLVRAWYYAGKVEIPAVQVGLADTLRTGRTMVALGFAISLSGVIALGCAYAIRIYISNAGGVEEVGLFNAGFAIVNTYVGMIFTAMGTDYYPRLAAAAKDGPRTRQLVNQQGEIAICILGPLLGAFIVFIDWIVLILYSTAFQAIDVMVHWAALGVMFKAASWAVAYQILAHGDSRLFFWNELVAGAYMLAFNVLGYTYWGLEGLGASFLVSYFVYLIQVLTVTRVRYGFGFGGDFVKLFAGQGWLVVGCFLAMRFLPGPWNYLVGTGLMLVLVLISYLALDRRLGIRSKLRREGSNSIVNP